MKKLKQKIIVFIIVSGIIIFLLTGLIFCILVMGYTTGYSKCIIEVGRNVLENKLIK